MNKFFFIQFSSISSEQTATLIAVIVMGSEIQRQNLIIIMKKIIFFFLILIDTGVLKAQNSMQSFSVVTVDEPMTLEACILNAIANNPNLRSVKLGETANDYLIKEIKAAGLPQVNGSGQYSNNYALAEQLLPGEILGQPGTTVPVKFGVANTITGNLEVQQLLFSKSYFTGLKAAKASSSLAQLNTFKTTEDLVYKIAQIYLQIQITEKQQEILQANIDRINQLVDISQIQFEEGIIKKIDVDQLKVNRTNLLTEFQNVEIGLSQQLNLLKFYMGMPPSAEVSVADFVAEGDKYPLSDELTLSENTNLQLLNKQMELTELDMENVKAGYYPSLSAFFRYGWQGQTDKLFSSDEQDAIQGTKTGTFGLSLNVPIFDGFQKKNKVQQIQVQQSQQALDRQYLTNSIQMEFANAKETLRQNKTVLVSQKENMKLAEQLYEVTKLSYREGVAPLTELLNAETSLKEAQTQYLTSLLQLNLAELDQMKTSGQLASLIRNSDN